ncbi:hypothetical protein C7M84_005592 [Penaeus vannamei]|uniref:Uncharacterized protein n=1 Tax=Penaeus vannamei TaxID=6689 RepID=A0A3R7P5B3_PENVA|nr:hypothetical protein C7M84_005592 [Penaeus vannamei]
MESKAEGELTDLFSSKTAQPRPTKPHHSTLPAPTPTPPDSPFPMSIFELYLPPMLRHPPPPHTHPSPCPFPLTPSPLPLLYPPPLTITRMSTESLTTMDYKPSTQILSSDALRSREMWKSPPTPTPTPPIPYSSSPPPPSLHNPMSTPPLSLLSHSRALPPWTEHSSTSPDPPLPHLTFPFSLALPILSLSFSPFPPPLFFILSFLFPHLFLHSHPLPRLPLSHPSPFPPFSPLPPPTPFHSLSLIFPFSIPSLFLPSPLLPPSTPFFSPILPFSSHSFSSILTLSFALPFPISLPFLRPPLSHPSPFLPFSPSPLSPFPFSLPFSPSPLSVILLLQISLHGHPRRRIRDKIVLKSDEGARPARRLSAVCRSG